MLTVKKLYRAFTDVFVFTTGIMKAHLTQHTDRQYLKIMKGRDFRNLNHLDSTSENAYTPEGSYLLLDQIRAGAYTGFTELKKERDLMHRVMYAFLLFTTPMAAAEVYFWTPDHTQIVVNVCCRESVACIKDQLADSLGIPGSNLEMLHNGRMLQDRELLSDYAGKEMFLAIANQEMATKVKAKGNSHRDFYLEITHQEQEVIRYIFKTLAHSSLYSIWDKEEELAQAGKKIKHIHPLKLLEYVFSDSELKNCMGVIEDRTVVWSRFSKDMGRSLQQEKFQGNLTDREVHIFAQNIQVDLKFISPLFKEEKWPKFLKTLIAKTPRNKDSTRYTT